MLLIIDGILSVERKTDVDKAVQTSSNFIRINSLCEQEFLIENFYPNRMNFI